MMTRRLATTRLLTGGALLGALTLGGCEPPAAEKPSEPKAQTRKTVGKTTQKVLDLAEATATGGVIADITAERSGLDAVTGAYRSAVGQVSILAVEHKMQLDKAEYGSAPKTHAEFMKRIIQPGGPDGISLPMLPYYQEYAFDPEQRCLVIVEFPALKAQREQQTTGAAGL
jgi:hypothetical protein